MKLWLPGLMLFAVSATIQAENYRIVQSPSQKLDVWIDNIKDNTPKSWCSQALTLRIVANGDKKVALLNSFMPRLGSLLENQCGTLEQVNWQLTDPKNVLLAQGTANKNKEWVPVITPDAAEQTPAVAVTPAVQLPEDLSPPADRTQWQEFTLQDGCRLRTFWQGDAAASALFIPARASGKCEKGGWLNERSEVVLSDKGIEKRAVMTFVYGFPVSGLNDNIDVTHLSVTSVNNERMVLSTTQAPQSWMILPYSTDLSAWKVDGSVAVEVPRDAASDEASLRVRLDTVRKAWTPLLTPGTTLNILLVNALYPQLRDPAVGTYRTVK